MLSRLALEDLCLAFASDLDFQRKLAVELQNGGRNSQVKRKNEPREVCEIRPNVGGLLIASVLYNGVNGSIKMLR